MKKVQLKKNQGPKAPRPPRPPKGTHRLYRRWTMPATLVAGMVVSWALLTQLPRLADTASERELLAFMYAGLATLVGVAAAAALFVAGLRRMKASAAGTIGGGRQFVVAFLLVAGSGIAFVAIRTQQERALLLWQVTLAVSVLVTVYLFGVRYTRPFTRDGVCLDQAPLGSVTDLPVGQVVEPEPEEPDWHQQPTAQLEEPEENIPTSPFLVPSFFADLTQEEDRPAYNSQAPGPVATGWPG